MRKVLFLLSVCSLMVLSTLESEAQTQLSRTKKDQSNSRVIERETVKKPRADRQKRASKKQVTPLEKSTRYTQKLTDLVDLTETQQRRVKRKSLQAFQQIEQLQANKKQNLEAFRAHRKRILKSLKRDVQDIMNVKQKAIYKADQKAKRQKHAKGKETNGQTKANPIRQAERGQTGSKVIQKGKVGQKDQARQSSKESRRKARTIPKEDSSKIDAPGPPQDKRKVFRKETKKRTPKKEIKTNKQSYQGLDLKTTKQ